MCHCPSMLNRSTVQTRAKSDVSPVSSEQFEQELAFVKADAGNSDVSCSSMFQMVAGQSSWPPTERIKNTFAVLQAARNLSHPESDGQPSAAIGRRAFSPWEIALLNSIAMQGGLNRIQLEASPSLDRLLSLFFEVNTKPCLRSPLFAAFVNWWSPWVTRSRSEWWVLGHLEMTTKLTPSWSGKCSCPNQVIRGNTVLFM